MIRTRFYVGLHDRDGEALNAQTLQNIYAYLDQTFGAYTIYQTQGCWKRTHEPSMVIEVINFDTNARNANVWVETDANNLRAIARQSTVLWTTEFISAGFAE